MKDWTGNSKSIYFPLGSSNHSDKDRGNLDFYATNPKSIDGLLKIMEEANFKLSKNIWENACGNGHLSIKLKQLGYNVYSTDIIKRDFECNEVDFLKYDGVFEGDIVTNPPYKYVEDFVRKSIEVVKEGNFVCMFLKITFLEGQKRRKLFNLYPPKIVAVYSKRIRVAKNGENFDEPSAACYAWFIWEKGFTGSPIITWI